MDISPASQPLNPPPASDLLAIPVNTDQDVLDRVAALIDPAARRLRTLWLFFFAPDGSQANLVVPIDDVPERPAAGMIGNICYIASEALTQIGSGGSVVITLSRPGTKRLTESDRHFLSALQHGARRHGTSVRLLCLATPQGIRELGPVTPLLVSSAVVGPCRGERMPGPAAAFVTGLASGIRFPASLAVPAAGGHPGGWAAIAASLVRHREGPTVNHAPPP